MSHLLPQSGEVCRGGQLAPGSFDDRQPVSAFTQQLDGPTHGGFSSGANGHERQRLHRGFCAASHQAPFGHQCRALQEAGVPHELQAARTLTNEPMTLGSPTNAGPLWVSLPFPFVLSKRLVGFFFFTSTDAVNADHQLFQQRLPLLNRRKPPDLAWAFFFFVTCHS